jgi:prolyl 4-hydroxylase
MSLQALSATWRDWLTLNLERGCNHADLLRDMRDGGIPEKIARAAISEVRPGSEIPELVPLPHIDCADSRVIFELLHPSIIFLDRVLSDSECDALVDLAKSHEQASAVVDPKSGDIVQHPARTGSLAFMKPGISLIDQIEARLSTLLNWPLERFEHLQVIGYGPSNEYRAHHDCFDESGDGASIHLRRGGQRVGTLLMYLKEPELGGETSFPNIGTLKVRPRRGSALWFQNVTSTGRVNPQLLHAGEPVICGTKYVCTAWLREKAWRARSAAGDQD